MTDDKFYIEGYAAGYREERCAYPMHPDYTMGFEDGAGDKELGMSPQHDIENVRPVDDDYYVLNPAPVGFAWAGVKRTPLPGDWYLSKGGNGNFSTKIRKNSQQRHILIPLEPLTCNCFMKSPLAASRKLCPLHNDDYRVWRSRR